MPTLTLLINHSLTQEQISDAKISLDVSDILQPNDTVKAFWANIDPIGDLPCLEIITDYLLKNSVKSDFVLVQGDFGATYYIVAWCFKNGRIPIYSTTKRFYNEIHQQDGSVKTEHVFKHINFRRYKEV